MVNLVNKMQLGDDLMNIVVVNKYKNLINSANIEILKELNGQFKVSEIANSFNSIFYKKLIIDATALINFPKEEVLRELVSRFDTERLILLLPPDNPPPIEFLSFLVSINLYNFTDNIKGLVELVNKSNTYQDVQEFAIKKNKNENNLLEIDNSFSDTVNINNKVILGVKSITKGGELSTQIIYMLKKALQDVHKKRVIAVECNQKSFLFYNDKSMFSIERNKLGEFLKMHSVEDIILVNLDNDESADYCTDVIFLVEPSLYRINELLFLNRTSFDKLKGKKVILVNSLLSSNDISVFAKEAGISIYFNLPPLNDRIFNPILNELLFKLGLIDEISEKNKKGLFDLFK